MSELFQSIRKNLSFLLVCLLVSAALAGIAALAARFRGARRRLSAARTIRKSIAESGDDLKVSTMKFVTPSASHRVEDALRGSLAAGTAAAAEGSLPAMDANQS